MPDNRQDEKLPVTAELGDEGGSYGDATTQAETFKGAGGNERVDPKRAGATTPEPDDRDGARMIKPPTED